MKYTKQHLTNMLIAWIENNGYIPTAAQWDKDKSMPSRIVFNKRFGTWKNALKAAGYDITKTDLSYGNDEQINTLTPEYKQWRRTCLDRDNHKCVVCGDKTYIQVHHLLRRSEWPELALNVDNGITLCHYCHSGLHSGTLDITKKAIILQHLKNFLSM
jgi:hypothetical protein